MNTRSRLVHAVVKRLERLERIRVAMSDEFEFTGDRAHLVRRDSVAAHVGAAIDEEVNNRLRAAIVLLGKQLGWRPIKRGNRRLFACVKLRSMPADEAAQLSKPLRAL